MSLVVINSWGPMGSSLLAALIEKWGYLNIPVRKSGLTDYLLGHRPVTDPAIKKKFRAQFEAASVSSSRLGTSVSDRNSALKKSLIDFSQIENEIIRLENTQFDNISELYNAYRSLYAEAAFYKQIKVEPGRHIELVVDGFSAFGDKSVEDAYTAQFDDVTFFHMTRNFDEWVESLASQYMVSPDRKTGFRLGQAAEEYDRYMESIDQLPGLKVDLEDLMIPSLPTTLSLLSNTLGERKTLGDLEQQEFDVWGGLTTFEFAFSKRDKIGKYLSYPSRVVLRTLCNHAQSKFGRSLGFHPFYLFEMAKYRILA